MLLEHKNAVIYGGFGVACAAIEAFCRQLEVAEAAVLMASDRASAITAAVANVTCGELAD